MTVRVRGSGSGELCLGGGADELGRRYSRTLFVIDEVQRLAPKRKTTTSHRVPPGDIELKFGQQLSLLQKYRLIRHAVRGSAPWGGKVILLTATPVANETAEFAPIADLPGSDPAAKEATNKALFASFVATLVVFAVHAASWWNA